MTGYRWQAGRVDVAFLWPGRELAAVVGAERHQRRCLLMFGPVGPHPAYCVLASNGAYYCPYSDVPGPPLRAFNAVLGKNGNLKLGFSLSGTHRVRPRAWMQFPHVDGYVHPWTSSERLRAGLRLRTWKQGHGPCYRRSEDIPDKAAITCVMPNLGRSGPCYPQHREWHPGEIAACGGPGSTRFIRWKITARD